jgi:hypothetical protein
MSDWLERMSANRRQAFLSQKYTFGTKKGKETQSFLREVCEETKKSIVGGRNK